MKRNLYIIIGAVVIVAIVIGAFWFIASSRSTTTGAGGTTGTLPQTGTQGSNNPGGAATGGTGSSGTLGAGVGSSSTQGTVKSFGVIANDQAFNYFVDAQNNTIIVRPDGVIEEVTNGQPSMLTSSTIDDLIAADFSFDGKEVLVSSGDPSDPQTNIFSVASGTWASLPQGLLSPHWSPSDYRIAYLTEASSTGLLSIGDLDASTAKKTPTALFSMNTAALSLQWLNKSELVLSDEASAYSAGSAWLFDMVQKTLSPLVLEKPGMESIWNAGTTSSPAVGLVFASTNTARGGTLALYNLSGTVTQNLKILTLASKCTFNNESSTVLYCGIPRDQSSFSFARLPDDYDQMNLFTSDDIYRIDLGSGAITTVWNDATQNLDVSDLKYKNGTLFFINRYDQKLYGLVLNQPTQTAQ